MPPSFQSTHNTVAIEEVDTNYEFSGFHLIASYSGCDPARLQNKDGMLNAMRNAVKKAGATLLRECDYTFENGAFTAVMLLSESHASVHTYPEVNACFIDLFTCGTTCDPRKFHDVIRSYLRPTQTAANIVRRNHIVNEFNAPRG
ncbi:MAG TPA: adenosylmethionine decarboxylase [Drouetiella sp.]